MMNRLKEIIRSFVYKSTEINIDKLTFYSFNYNEDTEYIILYLHGGAFIIRDISYYTLLKKISDKCPNISSLYLKYTLNNPNKNINEVQNIMNYLSKKKQKIILAGYSAGGYICLRYYIEAVKNSMPLPYKMLLISPWINPQNEINYSQDIIPSLMYNAVSSQINIKNIVDFDLNIVFCKIFLIYGEFDILINQIKDFKSRINIYKEFVCTGYGHTFLYNTETYLLDNIINKIINFIVNN